MFALPWLVWGSAIAQANGLISWRLPQGIALWVLTPSIVLAALLIGGAPALRDLGSRLIRWRVPLRVYVLAPAIAIVIAAVVVGIAAVTGHPPQLGVTMTLPAALIYLLYGTGLFLLTEEAGWRGLLLPRFQSRWTPLTSSLLLGIIWRLWHLPLLNVPGEHHNGLPCPVSSARPRHQRPDHRAGQRRRRQRPHRRDLPRSVRRLVLLHRRGGRRPCPALDHRRRHLGCRDRGGDRHPRAAVPAAMRAPATTNTRRQDSAVRAGPHHVTSTSRSASRMTRPKHG